MSRSELFTPRVPSCESNTAFLSPSDFKQSNSDLLNVRFYLHLIFKILTHSTINHRVGHHFCQIIRLKVFQKGPTPHCLEVQWLQLSNVTSSRQLVLPVLAQLLLNDVCKHVYFCCRFGHFNVGVCDFSASSGIAVFSTSLWGSLVAQRCCHDQKTEYVIGKLEYQAQSVAFKLRKKLDLDFKICKIIRK